MAAVPFPSPSTRLVSLESLPLSPAERATVLEQFAQLILALDALDGFVTERAEPVTGFDPLLGGAP
jgi:hypothetical protein